MQPGQPPWEPCNERQHQAPAQPSTARERADAQLQVVLGLEKAATPDQLREWLAEQRNTIAECIKRAVMAEMALQEMLPVFAAHHLGDDVQVKRLLTKICDGHVVMTEAATGAVVPHRGRRLQ